MAMSPALMGSASAAPPVTTQNQNPMQGDPAQDGVQDLMGDIRQLSSLADGLGTKQPALAPEVQQLKNILRQMIIKAASAASVQTPSGQAVPMAGQ